MFVLRLNKFEEFHRLGVVGRGSNAQTKIIKKSVILFWPYDVNMSID